MESPYHYKVSWLKRKTCQSCGFKSREQFTWGFLKPESAMEQAIFILKNNQDCTLLLVEQ